MKIIEGYQNVKDELMKLIEIRRESMGAWAGYPYKRGGADAQRINLVKKIVAEVHNRGDEAVREYTREFDGVELDSFKVAKKEIKSAYQKVDGELVEALKLAAGRIRNFHTAQKKAIWGEVSQPGLSQSIRPLERVGIYVPGGTAVYASTVLMTAIPARVAGVKEIILTTPPKPDGTVPPLTLVAADIAQVDHIFSVGGAQAIAALAFGTESIPRVDKICGPGNVFVMLAKREVYGAVAIDGLQGPSEVLIIADETANPEYCAADLLAQAEHDPLASAILITTSRRLADAADKEVEQQKKELPRKNIASQSLQNRGMMGVVTSIDEAIELVNLYAPEHLCLLVDKANSYIDRVSNAGCILAGKKATVVLGDYVAGPSHVLPTGGTARFSSPLNVSDFLKLTNVITVDEASLKELGPAARVLAKAEGLEAHARAVEKRLEAL